MDDKLLKQSLNFKQIREERAKEVARDNLFNSCQKNLTTVMIGALCAVEEELGFLWNFDKTQEPTELHDQFKEIWDKVRNRILTNGNEQIANAQVEFTNYEISKKRYQINLPVGKRNLGEKNEGK